LKEIEQYVTDLNFLNLMQGASPANMPVIPLPFRDYLPVLNAFQGTIL
jgi:hypothetical protein